MDEIAKKIRLTSWLSFWAQIGFGMVSVVSILFAWTGQELSEYELFGIGVSLFLAASGVFVLIFNLFITFRYTRLARRLRSFKPNLRPSKTDTVKLLRLGLITALIGISISLLGAGAGLGVQLSKAVSQPPGLDITDPFDLIRALDVLVVLANVDSIAAHFVSLITSLWLIEQVHHF